MKSDAKKIIEAFASAIASTSMFGPVAMKKAAEHIGGNRLSA